MLALIFNLILKIENLKICCVANVSFLYFPGGKIDQASEQTRVPAVRKNVEKWERSEQREMKESRKKRNFAPLPPGLALHFSTPPRFLALYFFALARSLVPFVCFWK